MTRLIAAAALAVAFYFQACARAPESQMTDTDARAQTEQALIRLERETMDAIRDKNADALSRILADDFVYRTSAGVETGKADFLKNVSSLPFKVLSVEGEHLKVNLFGETAVMTGIQHARAQTADGKEEVGSGAFTDVFVKRGGRWLLVLAYEVELQTPGVEE